VEGNTKYQEALCRDAAKILNVFLKEGVFAKRLIFFLLEKRMCCLFVKGGV
jgi:hypothetical protein